MDRPTGPIADSLPDVTQDERDIPPADLRALARERSQARRERRFDDADRLRVEIESQGWNVVDRGSEARLVRAHPLDIVDAEGGVRYGWSGAVPEATDTGPEALTVVIRANPKVEATDSLIARLTSGGSSERRVLVVAGETVRTPRSTGRMSFACAARSVRARSSPWRSAVSPMAWWSWASDGRQMPRRATWTRWRRVSWIRRWRWLASWARARTICTVPTRAVARTTRRRRSAGPGSRSVPATAELAARWRRPSRIRSCSRRGGASCSATRGEDEEPRSAVASARCRKPRAEGPPRDDRATRRDRYRIIDGSRDVGDLLRGRSPV